MARHKCSSTQTASAVTKPLSSHHVFATAGAHLPPKSLSTLTGTAPQCITIMVMMNFKLTCTHNVYGKGGTCTLENSRRKRHLHGKPQHFTDASAEEQPEAKDEPQSGRHPAHPASACAGPQSGCLYRTFQMRPVSLPDPASAKLHRIEALLRAS